MGIFFEKATNFLGTFFFFFLKDLLRAFYYPIYPSIQDLHYIVSIQDTHLTQYTA